MKKCLRAIGLGLCVLPPAIATLSYFPLWLEKEESALSAIALVLLAIAMIPLFRYIKALLRSPSAWMLWLVLFILLSLFRSVIDGLCMISFLGLLGGILGGIFFAVANRLP